MKKGWLLLLFVIGAILIACQSETTPTSTSLPLPTIGRPPFGSAPVSAISLLRDPASYQDLDIELAGTYKPLPLLVCADDIHRPPATWALTDGEIEIKAGGFDSPLRELASPGTELVVEGRWLLWEGPVGCGRRAPSEKIWYLEVSNIISPNPLVAGDAIAQLPDSPVVGPEGAPEDDPVQTLVTPDLLESPIAGLSATPPGTATGGLAPGTPEGTLIATATPTPVLIGSVTATTSATPSGTPTSGVSATPTLTSTPGGQATATRTSTSTPTASSTSPPTATSAGTATATTEAGDYTPIGYEDLVKRMISANDSHTYRFVASAGDTINIAAAPTAGLDISIELVGPGGNTLQVRGLVGAGQAESLGPFNIPSAGVHQVLIASGSSSGYYAVVVQTSDAQPFIVFQGNMNYGDVKSGSVPVDRDHMWNFIGSAGESITIEASATTSTDLILYLNGPDSIELDFADEDLSVGSPGDQEVIELVLSDNGLYTIGVGEIDFNPIGYTLTLTRN